MVDKFSAGRVSVVDPDGGPLTVDGTVTTNQGTANAAGWEVVGEVAHDAAASGNPVLVAGRANDVDPTAVANADSSYLWCDTFGRPITMANFPAIVPSDTAGAGAHGPKTVTLTLTTDAALVAAPGASLSTYVTQVSAGNTSATLTRLDLKDGTTTRYSMSCAANGGGFVEHFSPPWKITANTAFNGALGTAVTDVRVNVHFYTAP